MKKIKIFILLMMLCGCSSVIDGITGNFAHFDSSEYYQIVKLQAEIAESKNFCKQTSDIDSAVKNKIFQANKDVEILYLYASGKPYNSLISKQILNLKESLNAFKLRLEKGAISTNYCSDKIENLEMLLNILRKSSGEKKQ